ncbi:T9SS type A sorting domain-containing protein [Parafilimonas terrae]|uniref:Delta-60 repeat domain-containing protein/Por secretion system C-terminal sorting domain-containing protein n=1 Tax=Parafilimonas terrae TaxID=1465490 RepID=A0A1I5XFG9_9BACT|nr:T9SS type A sorting domain-containing protein [Parafilimonas terrae]SFQ30723.1 delta-60 repeat domain-containing protein/Por secretion system C-terminal sorting domain-containing protein [Parafilimonas terrae]
MKFFLLIVAALIVENTIKAQPGTLDNTFNDSGKVLNYGFGIVRATAIQSDGKILIAGETTLTDDTMDAFAIARYLPDGKIDESFGEKGILKSPWPDPPGEDFISLSGIYNLVLLKSGKILAGGYGGGLKLGYPSPILAQYLPDGSPDLSFGKNGLVGVNFSVGHGVTARGMGVMEDGRIVQAGSDQSQNTTVLRYMPDGSLDNTFGVNGISNVYLSGVDNINCLVLQPDGKIIVGGSYFTDRNSSANFLIARFKTDGTLDSSFGYNGKRIIDYNNSTDVLYSLALQPDGKILASGRVAPAGITTSSMCVVRFNPNGFYDSSFGNNGIALANFDAYNSGSNDVALQQDGKITACGFARPLPEDDARQMFSVAQFNKDGNLNTAFGDGGKTLTDFGYYQYAASLSLQTDGKIVVAGNMLIPEGGPQPYYNLALARYNNGSTPIAKKIQKILKWWRNRNNSITLNWQNTELNGRDHYVVQRATAYNTIQTTGTWVNIGRVVSSTTGTNSKTQSFTDNNPLPGTNYYRVQQVNPSGNIETTNVVAVTINEASAISVSPNPVQGMLYIKGLDASASYSLQVSNRQGNIVAKATVKQTSSYKLNVENLPEGVYYLELVSGINTTDLKFVKEQ